MRHVEGLSLKIIKIIGKQKPKKKKTPALDSATDVSVPSRCLQNLPPPLTAVIPSNTEAATDTVSGYVSLSLAACTTMARLFFYEDLKVQCVKRNPEHLEMKKKTKQKHTNK